MLVVVCQAHPAGRESAHDDRQQGTSHDSSSERTGASDPSGNKDMEGGTVCDRLEEHSRKGGRFAEGGREAARRPWRHLQQGAVPLHRAVRPGLGVGNSGGQADDELICSGHIDRV